MDTLEAIYARRSIRRFEERPVDADRLTELARLAMAAPSAMNRCPWEIVLVNEPEGMDILRSAMPFGKFCAPAALVMCANMRRGIPAVGREFWVQDCSAAMENVLLGVTAMGLGAVWLGAYPLKGTVEKLSAGLGLPSHIIPMGVAYIGHPAEEKEPRTQYRDDRVHWQRMGERREPRISVEPPETSPGQEAVLRAIHDRRSIRKYTGEAIDDEQIGYLLDAGFCAPTARNLRPWHFIVIREAATLEAIRGINPHAAMLAQAGCGIVVCGDRERQPDEGYLALDCAAATENILLAAHGMGLGAVWLGIYPKAERAEGLRRLLSIPETVLPIGVIAVGRPAEEKPPMNRYAPDSVHRERW